jgi:hypothetical protein
MLRLMTVLAVFVTLILPAAGQTKHAFVVGIDRYDNLPANAQLKKAVGDANEMARALGTLGFNVMFANDATRGEFIAKWYQFLEQAKPGDTLAFVFSGHGVELEGANFLLPRDIPRVRTGREGQLRGESISFGQLLTDMRERQPAFSLVVLDACRDNPFEEGGRTVGGRRGLGRVEALEGTFVMFSAGAGQSALDRLDDADQSPTSLFTRTLLPLILKPGLSLLDMADEVGEEVRALAQSVGHNQTPAFYSRVIGGRRLCLAGCTPSTLVALDRERIAEAERVAALERNLTPSALAQLRTFRDCDDGCPEMVVVPAGSFTMGSPSKEEGSGSEGPRHLVTIGKPFGVGKFEVTFSEWEACAAGGGCSNNPNPKDRGWGRGRRPVISVSWNDAKDFVNWLSRRTGKSYRLLSEAEWEYAARAGTTTPFSTGHTITVAQANFEPNFMYGSWGGNGKQRTVEVGSYLGNQFGLHDMHGNVSEWVEDRHPTEFRDIFLGFRVARTLTEAQ